MRNEYMSKGLHREDLNSNPIKQFELWFNQAIEAKLIEPNAMSLATVGNDQMPSIRTVLLKSYDEEGFVFFSNYKSKKAEHIEQNPNVALHFAWLGLERQVKIEAHCFAVICNPETGGFNVPVIYACSLYLFNNPSAFNYNIQRFPLRQDCPSYVIA